jgi:hypothetical protein
MLKDVLDALQFLSVSLSGVLGLTGLLYTFKHKDSERITKWGKFAFAGIAASLVLGISSKYIEIQLRRHAEESEAMRARSAAEQGLRIISSVERVANSIEEVNVTLTLWLPITSQPIAPFEAAIHKRLGQEANDQDLPSHEFVNLIPDDSWRKLARELLEVNPVILLFAKGVEIPRCFAGFDRGATIRFSVDPLRRGWVAYPQFGTHFERTYKVKIEALPSERPQVMSLTDFNDATVVVYSTIPLATTAPTASPASIQTGDTDFARQFPSTAWNVTNLWFQFDGNRRAYVKDISRRLDDCSGFPFHAGKIVPRPG